MSAKPVLKPGPDHPITVSPAGVRVVVRVGDEVLADTRAALSLQESTYPAALYVPRADADLAKLERSTSQTFCPYKGDASYYSVPALGADGENAVWTYETPFEPVAGIKDHLAFYPDKVTIEQLPLD